MCKRISVFLIVGLMLFTAVNAHAFLGGLKWQGTFEAAPAKIAWEYKTVPFDPTSSIGQLEDELNNFGKDGWELTEVVTTALGGYYILKRMGSV